MPGPYPLATLGPTINSQGISIPSYNDVLQSLIASMQSIFGSDIYLTPDTQDYQLIVTIAMAINDQNQAAVAVYWGFSPTYAQGVLLSSAVKLNGLVREPGTFSTASVVITGVYGTVITNGLVQDTNGNIWALPASVTIPISGEITVTATCQTEGAITAIATAINQINTVVLGWQSVSNPSPAVPGVNPESDAALRERQSESTAIAAVTPLQSILASVANVTGVERYTIYQNDTGTTDGNGVPGHSISVVVEGGSLTAIAQAIEETKNPGTGTYGSTSETVEDPAGLPITIHFFQLANTNIYASLSITPLAGWLTSTIAVIQAAIVDFINGLEIGEEVYYNWILGAATLPNNPLGQTSNISVLYIGTAPSPVGTADIPIAFNAAAACVTGNVIVTVL